MDPRPPESWLRSSWFLTTPPQPVPGIAARPRLISWLSQCLDSSEFALIAAPSGYGKTVMLSAFAHESVSPIAWLTLTRHERDDERLILLGLVSALERLSPTRTSTATQVALRASAPIHQTVATRDLYGSIAGSLAALPEPPVIVIDDAHHAGPILGDVVELLLGLIESGARFVLAGKPELLPWFAKRVMAQPGSLITSSELSLSAADMIEEAARCGEVLDSATAEARRSATDGWPIAFQMRQFSALRGAPEADWRDDLFVDFVDTKVLPALQPRIREFVLTATTCNRLDRGLAGALSGMDGAAALLEECVSSGLFLERITDGAVHGTERTVYRWHDAFGDACRRIVARTSPDRAEILNATAARELSARFPAEALLHAAEVDDAELTLAIIRSSWIRLMLESGARALEQSCLSLPAKYRENPEVLAIRACCINLGGDRSGARMLAARAVSLGEGDYDFAATYAFARLFLLDDHASLVQATVDAERLLSEGESEATMHAYRVFLVGWTLLRLRHDPARATRLLRTATNESRLLRRPILEKRAASNLFFALSLAGRLTDADRLLAGTLAHDDPDDDWAHYDGGIGLFAVGFCAYWRGRYDEAVDAFRDLIAHGGHDVSYAALGRVFLAVIAAARKSPRDILAAQAQLGGIGRSETHGMPWPVYGAIARASLLAVQDESARAIDTLVPLLREPNVPIVRIIAAELARTLGDAALAMDFLAGLTPAERSVSYIDVAAQITAALVAHQTGDAARAHERIERALGPAAEEEVLQPFFSADPMLRELLAAHAVSGSQHAEFIAARLADLESGSGDAFGAALSEREREVLAYLRTPMTAGEIATALFVSVNTVRSHQRAIYRKLGVTNRRDAVKLR
ncbi:helix-turn-helix transcriptional regulator [Leucobacter manosquensis]|uniref:AAA family ATPase n=1 Tax=Leucobacter manosquensis TaxID=2810611 RepID=A0ABS5M6L3_9MICO|nr:LuxR C-terminal-related transcriptional regulator [Leucobacter manosquensis]MBS3182824.1 AAA family ATPase [Leucobacter manosquensis]